jgi:hypothetical protein
VIAYNCELAYFVALPSDDLSRRITFERFVSMYHLQAICFVASPLSDFVCAKLASCISRIYF